MNILKLEADIKRWLDEDIAWGDMTTQSCIPEQKNAHGRFVAKEDGIICGLEVAAFVFEIIDKNIKFTPKVKEGEFVKKGDTVAEVDGKARSILVSERLALNLMQRMSGIASATRKAVQKVAGTKAIITDTRKTTPGLRMIEKYAVTVGGGRNHRFNLADGVMIKDNHIASAGSIKSAVTAARAVIPHTLKIEVEVETLEQLNEALEAGADIIMLDNMDNDTMKKAVELTAGRALLEASGNMGERDLEKVAQTGVDIISIGALTHTIKAMDISLKIALS